MMDIEKLIKRLKCPQIQSCPMDGEYPSCKACQKSIQQEVTTALSTLQAENEKLRVEAEGMRSNWYKSVEEIKKLRAELEQVKRGNDALWTYIEIVDREYRRYMDRGYIDRLDELKKVWKRGQKEN